MEEVISQSQPYHIPALLQQSLDALDLRPDGVYVDCTLGGGGHSRAILSHLDASLGGRLLSFDQDRAAIDRAHGDNTLAANPAFTAVLGNFRFLTNFLRFYGVGQVDGILADLGVSFHHFDDPSRGFSFRWEGPLDMRMNRNASLSAATLLRDATEEELADILHLYGELRQARKIARAIVNARREAPVETVERLLDIIRPLINPRQEKKELAQVFQAIRIVVNDEITALRQLLTGILKALKPGGRLAIITYHSLEDRLVKNFMKTGNLEGKVEKDFYGKTLSPLKCLTSKPIVPDQEEMERNPRSRSAKLRVAVRLDENS
ncbi:MAG: 16S rRNA (cytosine(1402)-N(4))-methyltransferase RsmH [Muribaculaceae bacterium]|nr:16S rRNA (cytosine(1402)-N(4))-methyltransferase RsmH [Muribaculaceae bacterium]